MKIKWLIFFYSCIVVGGCIQTPEKNKADIPIDSVSTSTNSHRFVSANTDTIFYAVVFANGEIVPFALKDKNDNYSNPWPQSFYSEETIDLPRPTVSLPQKWYFTSIDRNIRNLQFDIDSLVTIDIQCYRNWSYSSNLISKLSQLKIEKSWRLGFATTSPVELVSDSELVQMEPNLKVVRPQMNMTSSDTTNSETSHYYQVLGYFHIDNKLVGIGISLGYESEQYEIFEILSGYGRYLIRVFGGGC